MSQNTQNAKQKPPAACGQANNTVHQVVRTTASTMLYSLLYHISSLRGRPKLPNSWDLLVLAAL